MSILQAIILGIIQGLTEFLPVSSSGHIEISKVILGVDPSKDEALFFTVLVHFATAISTIVVFRKDILEIIKGVFQPSDTQSRSFVFYIVISMLPAVFVGLFFEHAIETLFNENLFLVGGCLLFTAFLLYICEANKNNLGTREPSSFSAFIIGVAQAVAILPGISRSGSTIATGLLLGIEKTKVARFSFLMVIPLIFGKIAKDLLTGSLFFQASDLGYLISGFLAALITGFIACHWMLQIIQKQKLYYFAVYCFMVGCLSIAYAWLS